MTNFISIQGWISDNGQDHVVAEFNPDTRYVHLVVTSKGKTIERIFDPSVAIEVGSSAPLNGVGFHSTQIAVDGKVPFGNDRRQSSDIIKGLPVSVFYDVVDAGRKLQAEADGLIAIEDKKFTSASCFGDGMNHIVAYFNPASGFVHLDVRSGSVRKLAVFDPSAVKPDGSVHLLSGHSDSPETLLSVDDLPANTFVDILTRADQIKAAYSGPTAPAATADADPKPASLTRA